MLCQFRINNYYISLIELYASNTLEWETWKYLFLWEVNYPCLIEMPNVKWITILNDLISLNTLLFLQVQLLFFTVCVCTLSLCWEASVVFGDSILIRSLINIGGLEPSCTRYWQFKTQTQGQIHPQSLKLVILTVSWVWQLSLPGFDM